MAKSKKEEIKEALTGRTRFDEPVFVSTGSTISNLTIGCGTGLGIQTGSLVNIVGRSGGGKSQLVNSIIGCANRDYKVLLRKKLLDSENGNRFDTEDVYGYSLSPDEVADCRTVEEAHADINLFLSENKPNELGIYAIDSIDGLIGAETDEAIEERVNAYARDKEFDGKSYGMGKAKYLSTTMLPDLANKFAKMNTIGIVCSQVRDNPNAGLYGPKDIVSNGRSLLFYSHIQIWIKKKQPIISGNVEIGAIVEYKISKGRGPRAYRTCLVTIYYTMGIDSIGTDVDYLFDLRSDKTGELLARANKPLVFAGIEFADREALISHIDENDMLEELKQAVIEKWEAKESEALAPIAGRKNRYKV